jgi:GntR family transcriptional regulator, rspAB operon transcriptional repressor
MARQILQQDVYGVVRQQIISWQRRPGEPLAEEALAREFGVSRTPLREVLRRLAEDGLVAYEPHRGARVSRLTEDLVRDTFLLREALEGIAARAAATRVSENSLRDFRNHYQRLAAAIAGGDLRDVGDGIHDLIFSAGASERLRKTMAVIMGQVQWIQHIAVQSDERLLRSFREHDAIVLALEARDPLGAEHAARAHVRSALAYVLGQLEPHELVKAS